MRTLRIDLVSDVVCPWCFIGLERLEQALAASPDVQAEVELHPFLLDPSTPEEGRDLREHLRKKYGADPDKMFGRVEAAAAESGLVLDFSKVRRSCSTVRAHTLLRHAKARGTQRALARALFASYFQEGRDIGDVAVLEELGAAHGFTKDEARALCTSEAELAETREEARAAAEQGIGGVPFTIFAERLAVSGAQPVEVFRGAIARALSEAQPAGA